ncbi:ankyrin repeat-containing domain protein [Flagelloscypha sp. PMI_526]|nr:ankyrin repeat-containing domain protein [Flagelloscypha sp. PMI_526]
MQWRTGVFVDLNSPFLSNTTIKCFVLVQNNQGHHPRALRNYRVRTVPSSRCTIRQALHTTLADLEHLPPVIIQDEQFISSHAHFPNPSRELMKELVVGFPKSSHLACFTNIGAGTTQLADYSETVAQDLLSQCKDVKCFFRLSLKNALNAGIHVRSTIMGLLQEEDISQLVDEMVEALVTRSPVIPLRRLVNLAGEDARARINAQINTIHRNVEQLRDVQDQSVFRRLKDWLKPIDHASKLESSNRSRGPTTCEWFFDHPVIEEWVRTGGLCWFHGGMGTGKTFIMSHFIQTMVNQGHIVAYYYFEFTNPSTLSEEALLRSLVFQLSPIHPRVTLASHEKHRGGALEPQLFALLESIVELARRSEQPFYIAIDALDEMPQPQRRQLFKTLESLGTVSLPNMHVIISSRDEIDIINRLGDSAQHKLDVLDGKIRHDIAVFVDQELGVEKWKHWPPNLIERMRAVLNERAAGQFRMVTCQLEVLHRAQTTSDLESRLITLPRKLADTYLYILDYLIPEEDRVRAQTLLRILTVAFGPVPLDELAALIAVNLGDPSDVVNLPKYEAWQQFHQPQNIVGLGTAFVRLTVEEFGEKLYPFLQLSHASVKEYLIQQGPSHWCYMDEQLAHSTLARACIALLLHNQSSLHDAPIRRYVRQRWFQHVQSNSSNQLMAQQIKLFEKFPWSRKTQTRFNKLPHYDFTLKKKLVYKCPLIAASAAGLFQLLQVILTTKQLQDDLNQALSVAATRAVGLDIIGLLVENGADVKNEGGRFGSPLQAAASHGVLGVVKFLVEKGADVNEEGGQYGTVLQAAARSRALDVVEFLVGKGVDVNKEGGEYGSALQAAATFNSLDIVEFLFKKGADVNKGGGREGSPLQAAAWQGAWDVVEFLIEKGADVNMGGGHYGSALLAAALKGPSDVVGLLIEKGADVNMGGETHGSALQAAASRGDLGVVMLLIEKGADVNEEGEEYGSAMQAAAEKSNLDVLKFLVEKGADVNKGGGREGSPLQAAAMRGRLSVVEFLVEKGADVNEERGIYGFALQTAVWQSVLDVVEFLVEKGADVNKEGGMYGSALQHAAYYGHLDVVRLLIEKGADVNKGGGKYGSALQAAASTARLDVIEFLIEKDADVNKEGGKYGSALQACALFGDLDVVEFLVEKGTDVNKDGGKYGFPLQAAARRGNLDVVAFLVDEGADVKKEGGKYGSALQAAAWNGRVDVVEFLIEEGVDVSGSMLRGVETAVLTPGDSMALLGNYATASSNSLAIMISQSQTQYRRETIIRELESNRQILSTTMGDQDEVYHKVFELELKLEKAKRVVKLVKKLRLKAPAH